MQLLGLDHERHILGILGAVDPTGSVRSSPPFADCHDARSLVTAIARSKEVRRGYVRRSDDAALPRLPRARLPRPRLVACLPGTPAG